MNTKEAEKGPGKKPAAFKSAGLSKTQDTEPYLKTWKMFHPTNVFVRGHNTATAIRTPGDLELSFL